MIGRGTLRIAAKESQNFWAPQKSSRNGAPA
jgi:hypothetical protein